MVQPLPTDKEITPELVEQHGISQSEYEQMYSILGRDPSYTELGIFSVMWSEHCSYKSSKEQLRKFPTTGPSILVKAGEENAGVVDIGDGWAIAFKVESHNHPSAVEPFQGAATGVGGILRDIFTMGARPVINMNSLRFGLPGSAATRHLVDGVVGGIASYGNCMGIPTIGGDVYFDPTYDTNCLVNAFSLGIMRHEDLKLGRATGVGNPVFYVGAPTGRDGIHGATFASVELTSESESKRSSVQVADPFMEKLLLEACLELFKTDHVVGIQDMGAAGLTCSTCEMASRGNSGIEIDVALVPQREPNMTPYEIMLSESQERMLIVVRKGSEDKVQEIFDKWDLHAVRIGHVTDDGIMRVKWQGAVAAEIPARLIADDSPVYSPMAQKPEYLKKTTAWSPSLLKEKHETKDMAWVLRRLLGEPSIASKKLIYRRYDHMVRTGAVVLPGSDAAVFWLKEADKFLALSADCNSRYVYLNPRIGGRIAVAESARNVVCAGGKPLALTDCLNFGSPNKPEIYWQFTEAIEGMVEACAALNTPVTGGNVSFYNENPDGAIDPTPLVVMVGLVARREDITTQWFRGEGDSVLLLDGRQALTSGGLGGSEYLMCFHQAKLGEPPAMDLVKEKAVQDCCLELIQSGIVKSAHDCSEGGLAVALAECCISAPNDALRSATPNVGANVDLSELARTCVRRDSLLFGEQQSRIIITVHPSDEIQAGEIAQKHGVAMKRLGDTGGTNFVIRANDQVLLDEPVEALKDIWDNALPKYFHVQSSSDVDASSVSGKNIEYVDFRNRRPGLIIAGVVEIILGFVLAGLLRWVWLSLKPSGTIGFRVVHDYSLFYVSALPQMLLAVFFVWIGIGSIFARRWARALSAVATRWWFLAGLAGLAYWLVCSWHLLLTSIRDSTKLNAQLTTIVITLTTVALALVYVAVPGILMLFYNGRQVKKTCEVYDREPHWTDKSPVELIQLIVPFVFAMVWTPMMLLCDFVFPGGRSVITVYHGIACIVLIAALFIFIGIGVRRLHRFARWAAMGLSALLGASWMTAVTHIGIYRLYDIMGYTNQHMTVLRQETAFEGVPMLVIMGASAAAFLLYLVRVRQTQ